MGFIERLSRDSKLEPEKRIEGHSFEAVFWQWMRGNLTDVEVANALGLDATELQEAKQFETKFKDILTVNKMAYFLDVWTAITLLQLGRISQTRFTEITGLV